jgi:flagellar biosynthesis protein
LKAEGTCGRKPQCHLYPLPKEQLDIMDQRLKRAAALKYRHQVDRAPKVIAKGQGIIAERIIETAKKHNIPLKRDPALIEVLCKLELDEEIPPELYRAVAEVLAYVYKMTKKL